jgi:predicted TIM-barrel fold metal-dependent hydrolase
MRSGHLVIDVDAHYLEPIEELADYMDEPWRSRIKGVSLDKIIPVALGDRMIGGRIRRDDVDYGHSYGVSHRGNVLAAMKRLGVDASILVANRLATLGHISMRDLTVVLAEGYIDYMLDRVADPDNGLYTMPVLPLQEPELAAAIVDRVGDYEGVVGVCLMTAGANPPLGDVRYTAIYEAAQAHGLPIVFHSTPGLMLTERASPVDGLQRLIESHSLSFAIENMTQLTSVIFQGVPERFPKLRFVFQESGVFWVPMMMFRLDEYYLKRRSEAPLLKMLPSEYIMERFYFGTQPLERPRDTRHLQALFEMVDGYNRFMYASDYPHFDYDDPIAILGLPFLTAEQKQRVLGDNALAVFDFGRRRTPAWLSTTCAASVSSEKANDAS